MARAKKVTIIDEVAEAIEEMPTIEVVPMEVTDEPAPVEVIIEDPIKETITQVVPQRKSVKKISLVVGKVGISDLRAPIGFDPMWKEDKVVTHRILAETNVDIIIPGECDLGKWVAYYKSLAKLGIRVVKIINGEDK